MSDNRVCVDSAQYKVPLRQKRHIVVFDGKSAEDALGTDLLLEVAEKMLGTGIA